MCPPSFPLPLLLLPFCSPRARQLGECQWKKSITRDSSVEYDVVSLCIKDRLLLRPIIFLSIRN